MNKSLALSVVPVSFNNTSEFEAAYARACGRKSNTRANTILPPPNHDDAPITERMSQPCCDAE